MRTAAQKRDTNIALGVALAQTGRKQQTIAREAGMTAVRLSKIKRGRLSATDRDRAALSRVLGRPVHELFPSVEAA